MKQQNQSAAIYPNLETTEESSMSAPKPFDAQRFRLQKIGELQTFLYSEIKCHGRLHKNIGELSTLLMARVLHCAQPVS